MLRSCVLSFAVLAAVLVSSRAGLAAPKAFDPEKHFPKECYFYIAGDIGTLRRAFRETPLGAMLTHPRVEKALGQLPRLIKVFVDEDLDGDQFTREFGVSFFDFLDMFQGNVALTSPTIEMRSGPTMVMSFELTKHRKGISDFFMKVATLEGGGQAPIKSTHNGCEHYQWNVRWGGAMSHAIVGNSLLFGSNGADLRPIIDRFKGEGKGSLRSNAGFKALRERVPVGGKSSLLTVYMDMKGFREKLYEFLESEQFGGRNESVQVKAGFAAAGIDALDGAMYQLGLKDGDWEGRLVLNSPKGATGAIKILGEFFKPAADLTGLKRVPASASQISCGSVRLGSIVKQIVTLSDETASKMGEQAEVEQFFKNFEAASGLSIKADLYTLPRIDYFGFAVTPPAGGFLPDSLYVCKREELQPYLNILRKIGRKSGVAARTVQSLGHDVTYYRVGKILQMFSLVNPQQSERQPRGFEGMIEKAFANPALGVYTAKIDDEWAVVGFSPQGVGRYLEYHSKSASVDSDEALLELIQGRIGRGSAFTIARGGKSVLAGYNTLTSLFQRLAPSFAEVLERFDIDPAFLPAGEIFAGRFKDGFLHARATRTSLQFHGHRYLSNTMASIGVPLLSGMVASLWSFRTQSAMHANRVAQIQGRNVARAGVSGTPTSADVPRRPKDLNKDQQRLLRLGTLFTDYMTKTKSRAYPNDPRGQFYAFQKLADAGVLKDPSVLVHPFSSDRPAGKTAAGKIVIEKNNCSYHVVPWKQGMRDLKSRILCYEKEPFKGGGRNILFVDGRIEFLKEAKFQSVLKKQTARYGKKRQRAE